MLLFVLIVSAVPMLIVPGRADSMRTMENITALSAQETWLRQHGWQDIQRDPHAWLMPTRNGQPRIVKPPLVIWLDMLAWSDLTPATSTAQQLIGRARLVSAAMGLMVVAGVYWIGVVLWDRKMAVIAALAAGTSLLLSRQARIASYDIHMAGWATLAIASAVWAMQPYTTKRMLARSVIGWCIAGVVLAGAYLSKGPLMLLVGVAPIVSTIIVLRDRWRQHLIGLLGMCVIAAALTAPWYVYVMQHVSDAEGMLIHEWKAERKHFQSPFYYVGLFALVVPWSVWLVAALVQPFVRDAGNERRRLLVAWVWFVLIFVAFSIPGAKEQRYIVPIMPAAALLVGQLWRYHQKLADQGELDPGINLLRTPHWVALVIVSLLVWPFFTLQGWMVTQGWLDKLPIGDVSYLIAAPVGLLLIGLAVGGAILHYRWQPYKAGIVTGLWASVLLTLVWYAQAVGPVTVHPCRVDCERVGELADGGVIGMLMPDASPGEKAIHPNEEFLLYARRIVPEIKPSEATSFATGYGKAFLVAPQTQPAADILKAHGYTFVRTFQHDRNQQMDLWRYAGGGQAQ